MMRTPILLLAGLLAVTVPMQPAQAACNANNVPGCVETVEGLVDGICDGYAAAPCIENLLCGGPNVNYCTGLVLDELQPFVDAVEDACGGSLLLCDDFVLGIVGSVQGLVDGDSDGVPDALEGEICGRATLRDAVNGNAPFLGACVTSTDYAPPAAGTYTAIVLALVGEATDLAEAVVAEAVETATGLVDTAQDAAIGALHDAQDEARDYDHDGVPDFLEPAVCGLENQNDPRDGSCVGGEYTPPVALP